MMCSGSHQILQNSLSRWSNIATAVSLIQEKKTNKPKTNQPKTNKKKTPPHKQTTPRRKEKALPKQRPSSQ